jgi:hypothetical protein
MEAPKEGSSADLNNYLMTETASFSGAVFFLFEKLDLLKEKGIGHHPAKEKRNGKQSRIQAIENSAVARENGS